MMSRKVILIHSHRLPEYVFIVLQITFLQIDLAQHNVRPAEVWIQPNGFLKGGYRFIPLELPRVSLAQPVVTHTKSGIDCDLFLQKLDATINVGMVNRHFAE